MGILQKILAVPNSPKLKKLDPATPAGHGSASEPSTRRPAAHCPVCLPPYGRHYWQDSYGLWRCTQCHPPAAVAMVRDQVLVDGSGIDGGPDGAHGEQLAPIASSDGSSEIVAGDAFPSYARGRWRYYEARWGRHWEKVGVGA